MNIRKNLTYKTLFEYISDYDLFINYCPGFKRIGVKFSSPFKEDKDPSAVVYSTASGRLRFNDFTHPTMGSLEFVQKILNLEFPYILHRIASDFKLEELYYRDYFDTKPLSKPLKRANFKPQAKSITILQVKKRKWEYRDHIYWTAQYEMTEDDCKELDIYPISYFWINGKRFKAQPFHYTYEYYFENGVFRRKLYNPFGDSKDKWISNGGKIAQGEKLLPKSGNLLLLQKALKDVGITRKFGYIGVASSTEKTLITKEYITKQLERFERVVLFLDNDETGIAMSIKHSEEYGLEYILVPLESMAKDISDYRSFYGKDKTKELLNTLLK